MSRAGRQRQKASSAGSSEGKDNTRPAVPIASLLLGIVGLLCFGASLASAAEPTVSVDPVTAHGITTAHATGQITVDSEAGGGAETFYFFQYSEAGKEEWNSGPQAFTRTVPAPTAALAVEEDLSALKAATSYEVRLAAFPVIGGESYSAPSAPFTTDPASNAPALALDPPSDLAYTTVHLSGTIDPEGGNEDALAGVIPIGWELQVNREGNGWEGLAAGMIEAPAAAESDPVAVEGDLTGLQPGAEYEYRLRALYAGTEALSSAASFQTEAVAKPTLALDPVTVHTDTTATFGGEVDTNAPASPTPAAEAAFETAWNLSCEPACPGLSPDGGAGIVTALEGAKTFSVDATGLEPNTPYEVTLEATNAGGTTTATQSFATTEVAPTVIALHGASTGNGGYILQGTVNPHNSPVTSCEFEYGPTAAYGHTAPCPSLPGAANQPVEVSASVAGLTVGDSYHFRLVAENGAGPDTSADREFTPTLKPVEGACPNEQLRDENNSLALPECRAYEQVSAPQKAGFKAFVSEIGEEGNVVYRTNAGNIANSGSGGILSAYAAFRSPSAWLTQANLNGPTGSPFAQANGIICPSGCFAAIHSADLRSSLWYAQSEDGYFNIYVRRPDGAFDMAGRANRSSPPQLMYMGASEDLSHLVYIADPTIGVPGPAGALMEYVGVENLEGRRVDVDSSGDPVSPCGVADLSRYQKNNPVSLNGRVIFFAPAGCPGGPPADEVWARVDGTESYFASESHCDRTAADPAGACNAPAPALFETASLDGSRAFFSTTQQLVNADSDETEDIYAYDLPTSGHPEGTLRPVSVDSSGAEVVGFVRASDDGSHAYFIARGVLASNQDARGEAAQPGGLNLYGWTQDADVPGGELKFIGELSEDDSGLWGTEVAGARMAQSSQNGRYLLIASSARLTDDDTDKAADVYRYDSDTGETVRLSTDTTGVGGNTEGKSASFTPVFYTEANGAHRSRRAMTNDGSTVVFITPEALASEDTNEAEDVYLWRNGVLSLISDGHWPQGAGAPLIDGSGTNVYFPTTEPMVASDTDLVFDVYDARIGGGFPNPPITSCSGEACQPTPAGSPAPASSSTGQSTSGNVHRHRACPKGKVWRHGRCQKKKHRPKRSRHRKPAEQSSNQRTSHDRGAGR